MQQPLYPFPVIDQFCPVCADRPKLKSLGFRIPCLFTLVEAQCPSCRREFLMQLPQTYGRDDWTMIEPATGKTYSSLPDEWFERMLGWGWRSRHDRPVKIETITRRPVKKPLIVNCIDFYYGHCLGRLYDIPRVLQANPDHDVIAIVQRPIAWMVPEGVAEIWLVDLPLNQGHAFSSSLTMQIGERIASFGTCVTDGTNVAGGVDITELTRVAPFDWTSEKSLASRVVTFIVREDRCWLYRARRAPPEEIPRRQAEIMGVLAQGLSHAMPDIDIAVTGFGSEGAFPANVQDMRVANGAVPDEIAWTERYARSHVVLGVHGSNMLLPAAHAAGSIEIMPVEKLVNIANAYQFIERETPMNAVRHHHFIPMSVTLTEVASLISAVIHFTRSTAFARQMLRADATTKLRLDQLYREVQRFPQPIIIEG